MTQFRTTKIWISQEKLDKVNKKIGEEILRVAEALDVLVLDQTVEYMKLQPIKVKDRWRQLTFAVYITDFEAQNRILLDFRLLKGCGLDFRRHFISIKAALKKLVDKTAGF